MRRYFIFFIVYEIVISFYFYSIYNDKVLDFQKNTLKLVEHSVNSTINTFELANDDFHSQHSYEMSKLVHLANDASSKIRDEIRQKLSKAYMTFYTDKKLCSLEGMQIFDKYGNSILRLHKPEVHDDPIINLRASLQYMVKNFSYNKGFEIGIYQESYRFQYPLFYDGDFVGSYEYSISFEALKKEMKKFYANQYLMIFKADEIDAIVTKETIKKQYKKLQILSQKFYYKPSEFQYSFDKERVDYILTLNSVKKAIVGKRAKVINYSFDGEQYDFVVNPVYDITNKHIGYMLVDVDNIYINNFRYELFINILLASLLSLMMFIYLLKQIKNKTYVRELINMQHDMLIVSDGLKIKDANKSLLGFFGYETLKEFTPHNSCICNFFIEGDNYLQKDMNGVNWAKYILQHPDKIYQVKMKDISDDSIKVFELEYEVLKSTGYIFLVFKDVTEKVEEYNKLVNSANYDELTNIYNRRSFEYYLNKELNKSSKSKELFSLIMFDIDDFKLINDEYGHDVGDVILKELTAIVSTHIRGTDSFARWGGEEFMIISVTDILNSESQAEKLRVIIEQKDFPIVGKVTCSFGVTQYHEGDTKDSIVKRCDNMLYSAKNSGKNCVASIR